MLEAPLKTNIVVACYIEEQFNFWWNEGTVK